MVLATLVLVVTSCVAIASLASSLKVSRDVSSRIEITDQLLESAHRPIHHWLSTESARIVLPVECESPAAAILNDAWSIDGHEVRMQVTAFDLQGMIPLDAIATGSSLRLALPAEMLAALDQRTDGAARITGLDELAQIDRTDPTLVFPAPPVTPVTSYGSLEVTGKELAEIASPHRPQAIGDFIAVSPAPPSEQVTINVNTAPLKLLDTLLRDSGTDAIAVIRRHREQTKPAPPPAVTGRLRWVGVSSLWGMRIDIHVDNVHRAWWEVHEQHAGSPAGWRCIQRLAVTE